MVLQIIQNFLQLNMKVRLNDINIKLADGTEVQIASATTDLEILLEVLRRGRGAVHQIDLGKLQLGNVKLQPIDKV